MSELWASSCGKVKRCASCSVTLSAARIDPSTPQNSVNGVVWYILGVNFVLTFYPIDIATVAILMYVHVNNHFLSAYPLSQPLMGRYSSINDRTPIRFLLSASPCPPAYTPVTVCSSQISRWLHGGQYHWCLHHYWVLGLDRSYARR
jgi:hypothetical protein